VSINSLIADDIVNTSISNSISDNYIISLNDYLKKFDNSTKDYIKNNIDLIINSIYQNDSILDLEIENKDDDINLNFIFCWDIILSQVERIVYDNAKLFNIDLDYDDIKDISESILDDDAFNDDLIYRIQNYDNGKEVE
jgi:hypothetical protein